VLQPPLAVRYSVLPQNQFRHQLQQSNLTLDTGATSVKSSFLRPALYRSEVIFLQAYFFSYLVPIFARDKMQPFYPHNKVYDNARLIKLFRFVHYHRNFARRYTIERTQARSHLPAVFADEHSPPKGT